MLVKKEFIDPIVKIMPDDEGKVQVESLFCNGTYSFMYDVKITKPRQFPDLRVFHVNNFQVDTSVAVEVQLQAWCFKPKGASKVTYDYSFKPIGLYQI